MGANKECLKSHVCHPHLWLNYNLHAIGDILYFYSLQVCNILFHMILNLRPSNSRLPDLILYTAFCYKQIKHK